MKINVVQNLVVPLLRRIKLLAFALFFLLALHASAHAGESGAKTKEEWIAIIKKDAKLSALVDLLGLPDSKRKPDIYEIDAWAQKVISGEKTPSELTVLVASYKGVGGTPMIVGIVDPITREVEYFPWADKVRWSGSQL